MDADEDKTLQFGNTISGSNKGPMSIRVEVANEASDDLETECVDSKGQLISKRLFCVIVSTKKQMKFF